MLASIGLLPLRPLDENYENFTRQSKINETLGVVGAWLTGDDPNETATVPLLQEALAILGHDPTLLRAHLLSRIATAFWNSHDKQAQSLAMAAEAEQIGRTQNDVYTIAFALYACSLIVWGQITSSDRLLLSGEIIRLARQVGEYDLIFFTSLSSLTTLLEEGQLDILEVEFANRNRTYA